MSVKLADYLFTRLRQLGIRSIFGVPGDYNLHLLDFVEPSGLAWVGTCNELNAAYAADGYARINGLSALITTFGVGELSAINGIAGAYTEKAPIIHIVGTPARTTQEARALVHHTLADGEFRRFADMASHVTVAQVDLKDPRLVPDQVDWVLREAIIHSRPVYLEVPDDMVDVQVDASNLTSMICLPPAPATGHKTVVLSRILERIYTAKRPLILVDGESRPMNVLGDIDRLVKTTGWPTWTTIFGKSLVNEQLPNVYGVYAGSLGDPQWKKYFDSADLIINMGPHYSDTNSQNFTTIPNPAVTITFSNTYVQIDNDIYRDTHPSNILPQILEGIDTSRIPRVTGPAKLTKEAGQLNPSDPITQKDFYKTTNAIIRDGDLVLTETGTAAHGARNMILPENTRLLGPATWLSIGYMLPATLGAALAQRERANNPGSRVILFIGDGSLQMTVQEISTMIRENLNVIIIVINNEGYTIERAIHGRKQLYNDIATWRHAHALSFFGADNRHAMQSYFSARTWGELDVVLRDKRIQDGTAVRMVEVFMGREDVQGALLRLMEKQIADE
ncbi:thiamine diphosphate-binding protein [Aspergillus pseudotamarii]|uniref:Pyruvate decarboxylase n=1 Tax=Aspergillus pseudotamarii TaxID=132259 RepID=A0A5N6SN02_ASPPS|nr:thiamine diphosphate-binding protein [Aspergillus pseudotamarii]KAE8136062.1 thiamine diphosphate-binding protein [Aspergillus pseudotamarii]